LIENAGVSTDGIVLMVVVAGQTLPACLGVLLALTLIDRGWVPINTLGRVAIFAGIFMATAAVTEAVGISRFVAGEQAVTGNPVTAIPAMILSSYLNTYGVELLIAAVALGSAAAVSIGRRWRSLQ
jgi:hypothetical protein